MINGFMIRVNYTGVLQYGTPIVEFSNTIVQCFITPFQNN